MSQTHCSQHTVYTTTVILQHTVCSVTNLLTEGHKCLAASVISTNINCTPEDCHAGPKHAYRGLFQVPFINSTVPVVYPITDAAVQIPAAAQDGAKLIFKYNSGSNLSL
jgi:hypothetical protein